MSADPIEAILDAFTARGLRWSWEYPGMAVLMIDETHSVSTGLTGWEYGSRSVLVDGGWEPDDRPAEPFGLDEDETDPEAIADAWADWIGEETR